jgi:hypothetical protein
MSKKILVGGELFKIKKDKRRSLTWGVFRKIGFHSKYMHHTCWVEMEIGFKSKEEAENWLTKMK